MFRFLKKSKLSGPNVEVGRVLRLAEILGLNVHHIVDVGANKGDWSRCALSVFPEALVSAFEPQERLSLFHADLVRMPNVLLNYIGLGDIDSSLPFTLHSRDDSCSFVHSQDQAKNLGYEQIDIIIRTLDSFLVDQRLPKVDILKIDAEGLDLKVLAGAKETLKDATLVFIEASVSNLDYPNDVLSVMKTMDDHGFSLFDVTDLNRAPKGSLWLTELVFVRNGSNLDKARTNYM